MVCASAEILALQPERFIGRSSRLCPNAAPRPAWNEVAIDCHDSVLPITKIGICSITVALRLGAFASTGVIDGKVRETPVIELRRFIGSGFRAALTEQFGLPYLFGSGELSEASNTGPETNLGADCANFVVYAFAGRASAFHGRTRSDCASILIISRDQPCRAHRELQRRICSAAQSCISAHTSLQ